MEKSWTIEVGSLKKHRCTKRDGDVRVSVDMRRANFAIIRERHPNQTIEDALQDLNSSTFVQSSTPEERISPGTSVR